MTMLAAEWNWRRLAACRFTDPDLFFPVSASGASVKQVAAAKAVCAGCQVRRECLAFALATRQVHGVWGGMSAEERRLAAADRETGALYAAAGPGPTIWAVGLTQDRLAGPR
jgi:WhiB family transcriptional regulator, redox-sensing transcriptional regulator